jgi:hypothetical protein
MSALRWWLFFGIGTVVSGCDSLLLCSEGTHPENGKCVSDGADDSGLSINTDTDSEPVDDFARMELSQEALVWEDIGPGFTVGNDLVLSSVGATDLVLYESRITDSGGGVFYLPQDWLNEKLVAPGSSVTMTVTASFPENTEPGSATTGTLRIRSNDAESPAHELPLLATLDGG